MNRGQQQDPSEQLYAMANKLARVLNGIEWVADMLERKKIPDHLAAGHLREIIKEYYTDAKDPTVVE